MSPRAKRSAIVTCALVLLSAATATPQTRLKGIVHTPGNDPLIAREQVTIEGAGKYPTDNDGEFEFDLTGDLKVGRPARFHVKHVNLKIKVEQWIVVRPCDLVNGRTFSLPAIGSEPISIVVLPGGDPRLKSLNKDSILSCTVEEVASEFNSGSHEEVASEFKPGSPSGGSSRSSLFNSGSSVIAHIVQYRPPHKSTVSRGTGFPRVAETVYRVPVQEKPSVSSLGHVRDSTLLDQAFVTRKAEELGFTPEELVDALNAWARSVEDRYEKGLAALYERRFAQASELISASIPSPPGELVKRYVPLARAEHEQGHYPAAEAALRKVLAVHSDDPLILNDLGVVLREEAKHAEAESRPKLPAQTDEKALGPEQSNVARGQEATAKRNLVVRRDPSKSSPILVHVAKGDRLTLLQATADNGYYNIETEHDVIGWVLASSVNVSPAPITTPTPPTQPPPSGQCDDTLWGHVYHSYRLIVYQKCISVTGTIVDAANGREPDGVRHEPDGDTHGWLKVDSGFQNLLNTGNLNEEGGNLVFEIICKFPVTQGDAKAACQGYKDQVSLPPVGSHVRIEGTYVQDTFHAQWMEIHPVTSITVVP